MQRVGTMIHENCRLNTPYKASTTYTGQVTMEEKDAESPTCIADSVAGKDNNCAEKTKAFIDGETNTGWKMTIIAKSSVSGPISSKTYHSQARSVQ